MPARLIVKVRPDERVEVKVEGLTIKDRDRPNEKKLCKKVTQRLEQDLGEVTQCVYDDDGTTSDVELANTDNLELGG